MTFFTEKSYNRYIKDINQTLNKSQPVFKTEYWINAQENYFRNFIKETTKEYSCTKNWKKIEKI